MAVLVPFAIWGWVAVEMRASTLAAALADQRRVAEALGENTLKLLETQAFALDLVDREAGERDCPALRSDPRLQGDMHFATQSPQMDALWIIDAEGFLCMASDPARMDARSRSFREYFVGAREAPAGRYYVDRAIIALLDSLPAFDIAKARRKNGAFNGIVLASLHLKELIQHWQKVIDTLPTQRIALFRKDGATIARSWEPLVPDPDPAAERRVAAVWQTAPNGTTMRASAIDGTRRVGAWHSLPEWGVVVTSSVDQEAALAPWRRSTLIYGIMAMVVSGLLGTLARSLLRERRILARVVEERTGALRESQSDLVRTTAVLHAIGTCSPDPIYAKDTEGRFLFANPAVLAIIGKTEAEVIGRTDAEWHPDPAQAAAVMANDRRIIETGRVERLEETFDAAGVGTRVFLSAKAPLHTEDGSVLGVVAVSSDITQIKHTEAELRRLTETLEERVRAEVAAREDAQARAAHAQRMQALGQLAGGIAHDFNNTLQAVQGGAGLIEARAADPASVRRLARAMTGAAERGAAITRRLLSFARRGDLRAERIDPAGLLDGLRDVLVQTLGSPITVRVKTRSGLAAVMADRSQLETVLVNLATNARDAMPDGGTLTLAAAAEDVVAPRVHPAGLECGQYVCLTVTDSGTGMDRTTLERAVEPFFTTKSSDKGTGLGLSMAKGFAEQSGGALAIESEPGRGTTVTLWLPVAGACAEAAQVQPGLLSVAGLARRVLVVDDEDLVREMLVASLEDAGFAVLAAENGTEALALLEAGEAVDVLVSDLSMPGMGGLALIREAQVRRSGLPAVLLTGYAGEAAHLVVSGAPPGAFSLLRKPVSVAQLVDRIEMVLAAKARSAG